MAKFLIFGDGGHALSCYEVLSDDGHTVLGLVSENGENKKDDVAFKDLKIFKQSPDLADLTRDAVIGVGQIKDSAPRENLYHNLKQEGFRLPKIISSKSLVSKFSDIGESTFVFKGALININTTVGINCIINSGAIIEHDCLISDHCHVSVGAKINGGVTVGSRTFIGSGSIIRNGVTIGDNCIIAAGKYVFKDVPSNTILK